MGTGEVSPNAKYRETAGQRHAHSQDYKSNVPVSWEPGGGDAFSVHLRSDKVEFRRLGASGFNVPVLSFGAGTFGGKGEFFQAWGASDAVEARHLVDICLEAGINMFDTAD